MTLDEAIKDLKSIQPSVGGKSLKMAIQALEKQQEMIEHCDGGCLKYPYNNPSWGGNACMNDFIIDVEEW